MQRIFFFCASPRPAAVTTYPPTTTDALPEARPKDVHALAAERVCCDHDGDVAVFAHGSTTVTCVYDSSVLRGAVPHATPAEFVKKMRGRVKAEFAGPMWTPERKERVRNFYHTMLVTASSDMLLEFLN